MTNRKGYYDIEIDMDAFLLESGLVQDLFYLQDLKQRKLFLNQDVSQISVAELARVIMQFNAEDKGIAVEERMPIKLYVASNGGDVDSGFELIDIIEASKTPVYTINLGNQYSMGFLIGLCGHKRFAFKNSKYLMHDGSSMVWNSGAKAQDQMEFNRRVEERIKQYVLAKTNIDEDEYNSKLRVEWYMFADEAKEKGVTDYIIGVDCDIDAII